MNFLDFIASTLHRLIPNLGMGGAELSFVGVRYLGWWCISGFTESGVNTAARYAMQQISIVESTWRSRQSGGVSDVGEGTLELKRLEETSMARQYRSAWVRN